MVTAYRSPVIYFGQAYWELSHVPATKKLKLMTGNKILEEGHTWASANTRPIAHMARMLVGRRSFHLWHRFQR